MEREDIDKILDDYLSEYHKRIIKEEIERLNKGYCELKEKCNRGDCDCTKEEYNNMCEANIKLMNRIDKAIEYIENNNWVLVETLEPIVLKDKILNILKGSDK